MTTLHAIARLWPADPPASEDLRRAVAFLGWDIAPATVVSGGYGLGALAVAAGLTVLALTPLPFGPVGWLASLSVGFGIVHLVHVGPRLLATARRTSALGAAPELVVLAVLRMRLAPATERAADFAAETGDGRLADSLAGHVRAARTTGGSGLETFGDEWARWFPSLGRALGQVTAAGRLQAGDRDRALDRALSVVLDGTRRQMQDFAGSIHGPTTGLYAFGVLLPTALVSLLPAARAAGLPLTLPVVVAIYDVVLPVALVAASAWVLSRRPVAFPPPDLSPAHPAVPDRRRLATLAGLVAGLAAGASAALVFPAWAPPVAAAGVGAGVALSIAYRPYQQVEARLRTVEDGLTDALSLIGRRVAHGASVERAIATAADDLDGEVAELLEAGASRQARLDVGVERAFLGEHGALRSLPSPRVRGSVSLLATAAHEGRPAGRAILSVADHIDALQSVEREARADLRTVVDTLRSTGRLFGPLVGGATVALAGHMGEGAGLAGGDAPAIPWLGVAVGGYVLVLAVVLTTLSIGLRRGLDRHLVAAGVGSSLLVATASYFGGYLAAALVA